MKRRPMLLLWGGCLVACSSSPTSAPSVGAGVFTTATLSVPTELVEAPVAPSAVRADLLLATAFAASHPGAGVAFERRALARALLDDLKKEMTKSAFSEDELARARERLWLELARPPSFRLLSASIAVPRLANDEGAYRVAMKVAEATREDLTPQAFIEHARAAGTTENPVQVQVLAPISEDGRVVRITTQDSSLPPPPKEVVPSLSKLNRVGARSDIVGTPDGFYVFLTVEALPALRREGAEAEEMVKSAVLEERLAPISNAMLQDLKKRATIVHSPRIGELLPLVWNSW